jgi:multimeric flavodoxin WrbA
MIVINKENVMKKKVLILAGSPRKGGNSDLLCDRFLLGAEEAGHRVEKLYVAEQEINFCTGCGACFAKKGYCPQQDDMAGILEKMIAADVIVMASPVYFFSINGQMKTLIDRTCPGYTDISNKEFYFIMTAAVTDQDLLGRALETFRGFTSCLEGAKERGVIYGTGAWKVGEIKESSAMSEAYALGKNL